MAAEKLPTSNDIKRHIEWMKAEIRALDASISRKRSSLTAPSISATDRKKAEALIAGNLQKIDDLNEIISRYDGTAVDGSASNLQTR